MRLDKYLADMGCGTRSELKQAIRRGRVTVGGKTAKDPGLQVTGDAEFAMDGAPER